MDRYEAVVKAEEVIKYAETKDYKKACEILDTINTSRMKNYDDLIIFAEVYLKNKRFIEAKEILVRVHNKTITRRLVALLISVTAKMHNYVEAEEYYKEYIEIAPKDVNRFILRYKIDKAKGLNYDVLIKSLEQLKEYDMVEEWEYELAKLYHKAGYEDKCISECNSIIMMFGAGTIVEKAKLLRDHHIATLSVDAGGKNVVIDSSKFDFNATTQLDKIIDKVKEKMGEESKDVAVKSSDSEDYGEDISVSAKIEEEYAKDNDKIDDEFLEKEAKIQEEKEAVSEQIKEENLPQEEKEAEKKPEVIEQPVPQPAPQPEPVNGFDISRFAKAARQMTRAAQVGIDDIINNTDVLFVPPKEVVDPKPARIAPAVEAAPVPASHTIQKTAELIARETDKDDKSQSHTAMKEIITKSSENDESEYVDDEDYGDGCRQLNLLDGFLDSDEEDDTDEIELTCKEPEKDITIEVEEDDEIDDDFIDNLSSLVNSQLDKIFDQAAKEAAKTAAVSEYKAEETAPETEIKEEVKEPAKEESAKEEPVEEKVEEEPAKEEENEEPEKEEEVKPVPVIIPSGDSTGLPDDEIDDEEYNKIMQKLAVLLTPSMYTDTDTQDISENIFRNFYHIPSLRMNVRSALKNLEANPLKGNFIICGTAKSGRTTLAKMIAKTAYSRDVVDTNKVARIDAEKFNNVDLEYKQDKLADGCLIIQNAHNITPSAMTSLITMIVHLNGRIVVFLETEYDYIAQLYLKTTEVREYFTGVVSTPEYTEKELAGFAKSYAAFKGFSFNESGMVALNELLESVYPKITKEQRIPFVLTSVEKAIRASLSRNNSGFGRPNVDGLNVLEMQDVEQQYI